MLIFKSPSPHITEGSFGSLFKAELISSESFRLACLFLPVHTFHSGGIGATSTGRHVDSSIPGRLAVVRQIIPTGCQQHTAFVVSCSHIGSTGELSEEVLNPKPLGVFSLNAV